MMKIPVALRFTTLEVGAMVTSVFVLVVGTVLSVSVRDAGWMPGVGAIVIVVGVIFALRDFDNVLQIKADHWAILRKEFAVHSRIDDLEEEEHRVLSDDERRKIRGEIERDMAKRFPSHGPTIRKRVLVVEVIIVCVGSLVNGFGQKVVECWLA